jgi:hypothetical protein
MQLHCTRIILIFTGKNTVNYVLFIFAIFESMLYKQFAKFIRRKLSLHTESTGGQIVGPVANRKNYNPQT